MIDLHSHILPGIDDGAPDLATSLAMARMALDDGIKVMACTPHFLPGLYDNEASDVRARVVALSQALTDNSLELILVPGGDIHVRPDFVEAIAAKRILTLNDSRYVLLEPPHVIMPLRLEDLIISLVASGTVPIITHPERLAWIEQNYASLTRMVFAGAWLQITAGSVTGRFGARVQYWTQRLLQDGLVHIMSTDAHNLGSRPPRLSNAVGIVAREIGPVEAQKLVFDRPLAVLHNEAVEAPHYYRQPAAHWQRG
jgi:protein-tyrosine phosphatase